MNFKEDSSVRDFIQRYKDGISAILRSIANERRLEILYMVFKTQAVFGDIQKYLGLGKTALSHHLRNLGDNGLINQPFRGVYEINQDGILMMNAIVAGFAKTNRREIIETKLREKIVQITKINRSESSMQENEFKVKKLNPMKVASIRIISTTPEVECWAKMESWAKEKGFLNDLREHPVYGFNNPLPKEGNPEYGYEFWMKVGEDTKSDDIVNIKDFSGGLFAVKRCDLGKEMNSDFFKKNGFLESWSLLDSWVQNSKYKPGDKQMLEKIINPGAPEDEVILDLYYPIQE
jgi:DNA-binding transcriptional ArsR family regulator/DNA gyrase inhibitor GyrI